MWIKNKVWKPLLIVGIFCCALAVTLVIYVDRLEQELNEEIVSVLKETSEQNVVILNKEVEGKFILLEAVANRLADCEVFEPERELKELQKEVKQHSLKRIGIIMADGTTYTTDQKQLELGDKENILGSMKGKRVISRRIRSQTNGEDIIVFSVPIYKNNEVHAVVFSTHGIDEIQQMLSVSIFDGAGYSYIVETNGNIVINTAAHGGFAEYENIYTALENSSASNSKVVRNMREDLQYNKSGYIYFHNKVDKYMYYSPLPIRDWYVLSVVPADIMDSTKNNIMILTYVLCGILAIAYGILISYIIQTEKKKQKELTDILYVDTVTGGYSYARFCAEAAQRLKKTSLSAAYIVMDIDQFKIVNELFGYEAGDATLRYIWRIWRICSRADEVYARRIADQYVVLWFFDSREELHERVEDFLEILQKSYSNNISEYMLKATLGIYLVKDKSEEIQNMMNYATMAHSAVKGKEDTTYTFYDDDFKHKLLNDKLLADQMKRALRHREFIVYYQPKYNVMTKRLVGAEALVRWKRRDGSIMMPGRFIPLAEKSGFVNYLDKYVFAEVCRKQKEWLKAGRHAVPISVNLSRRHLYSDDFMDEYKEMVEQAEVPARYLQLELTESAIFENKEELCQIIDTLHSMGFNIQMDDFGTGYSSLMMLKSVPIDVLKLDKSFVDDFDDPKGQKIITSVINLAQELHIEVTAEGVETKEQYEFLRNLGCNTIQGYYFSLPMPEEEFEKLLSGSMVDSDGKLENGTVPSYT